MRFLGDNFTPIDIRLADPDDQNYGEDEGLIAATGWNNDVDRQTNYDELPIDSSTGNRKVKKKIRKEKKRWINFNPSVLVAKSILKLFHESVYSLDSNNSFIYSASECDWRR